MESTQTIVSSDSFLVMTSNVFAILGLRSLYFALAALMGKFRYLKISLVFVLLFIAVKMVLGCETFVIFKISTPVSLAAVAGILAAGVVASLARRPADGAKDANGGKQAPANDNPGTSSGGTPA